MFRRERMGGRKGDGDSDGGKDVKERGRGQILNCKRRYTAR